MLRLLPFRPSRSLASGACGIAVGLLLLTGPLGAQALPAYHAEYLGAAVHVAAMNDAGLVVGTGSLGIHSRAYVAGPGKPLTYLPIPFGFLSSGAADINESGVIVGVMSPYQTTSFYPQPARWDPDGAGGYKVTLLLTLPGDNRGTADAINDLGDIVGTSNYQSNLHTVLYAPTGTVNLPGLASYKPLSLNNQRLYVTGNSRISLNTLTVQNLGVPAGFTSAKAWVINNNGQVAGDLTMPAGSGCPADAGVYTDGLGWLPVGACGATVSSYDINDLGDVLLQKDNQPWLHLQGGPTVRVEDLIVAQTGHWTVNSPYNMALNDLRQMAVYATNGGLSGIILITPDTKVVCQTDLGYDGPGALQLSMCGGDLSSGTHADLQISGAAPGGLTWLLASATQQPTPFKGGTLVPVPVDLVLSLTADGNGVAGISGISGGNGPFSVYLQAVAQDPGQPQGWTISQAVRADFLP